MASPSSLLRRHSHTVSWTPQEPRGNSEEDNLSQQSVQMYAPRVWGLMNGHRQRTPITAVEIYYGTMFGMAERYARALAHEISNHHPVAVHVEDLDAFKEDAFAERDQRTALRVFVFVVSTHFAGAPSPSAERFRDWLNRLVASPQESREHKTSWHGFFAGFGLSNSLCRRRLLSGMQYTVFGIGDSAYLTYNAMGKFVDAKLKQLGATRFHALGLGDCSSVIDRSFNDWKAGLLLNLPPAQKLGIVHPLASTQIAPARRWTIKKSLSVSRLVFPANNEEFGIQNSLNVPESVEDTDESDKDSDFIVHDLYGRIVRLRFGCRILSADEVRSVHVHGLGSRSSLKPSSHHASHTSPRTPRVAIFDDEPFADIMPVDCVGCSPVASTNLPYSRQTSKSSDLPPRAATFKVCLLNTEAKYTTVSTLAIFPQNSDNHVNEVAKVFGYDLAAVIDLHADSIHHEQLPFPTPCTIRTALTEFIELNSLTREFVRAAAGYVSDPEERELLSNLASTDGASTFRARLQDQHKGILDLVDMAPTLQMPLNVFLSFSSAVRPRYFTIASSPLVSPREVDLAVLLGRPGQPQGLAVSYFERLLASATPAPLPLRGFISSSRFQFQDDGVSPMILIASGVGFSAMRAIIFERLARWQRKSGVLSVTHVPNLILFLGTTNEDTVIFHEDLRHWEQQLVVKVNYAFSNDRHRARRYVQDVVASRIDEIVQIVQSSNNSRVIACGRTAMVHRIREIFDTDQTRRGTPWFDVIHKSRRFIEEGYN